MNYAMANGVNIGRAPDLRHARSVGGDVANQVIQRRRNVSQRSRELLLCFFTRLKGDNRFAADALNFTPAKTLVLVLFDAIQIGGNDLKLQAGTSGVQYKDIHQVISFGVWHQDELTRKTEDSMQSTILLIDLWFQCFSRAA